MRKERNSFIVTALLFTSVFLFISSSAWAHDWIGSGAGGSGTDWNDPANWFPNSVPGESDWAHFYFTEPGFAAVSGPAVCYDFSVDSPDDDPNRYLLIEDGGVLSCREGWDSLIGDSGFGYVRQTGGECHSVRVCLGENGGNGCYAMSGGRLNILILSMGYEGNGTFEIAGDAVAEIGTLYVGYEEEDAPGSSHGEVIMAGGTINVKESLLLCRAGTLEGYGTVNGPIANDEGIVRAGGGILNLNGLTTTGCSGTWIVEKDAELGANGYIQGDVTNEGILSAHGGALVILGDTVTNTGTFKNEVGSDIFVYADNVDHTGDIEVNAMGVVSFDTSITNGLGKRVDLLGGVLAAPTVTNEAGGYIGGFGGITGDVENYGFVDLYGTANIVGDVHNCAGGELWARNDVILITGLTTNDYGATIHTFSAKFIFNGGLINNGSLITDPTTVEFNNDLIVGEHGTIQTDPGDRYVFLQFASLVNMSVENMIWDTEGAILQFNGNGMEMMPQTLEASGADLGAVLAGFIDNFAWNTLQVGTSDTYLQILDEYDSSVPLLEGYGEIGPNEAIYVHNLMLEAGATLDLNGYNLYYDGEFTDNGGTILNGAPIHVESIPEPGTLLLLAPALLGLAGIAKKKINSRRS